MENAKWLPTVVATEAFFDGSAMLVAVSVTPGRDGRICGAVKRPEALMEPQAGPEQPLPVAAQLTVMFGCPADVTMD